MGVKRYFAMIVTSLAVLLSVAACGGSSGGSTAAETGTTLVWDSGTWDNNTWE